MIVIGTTDKRGAWTKKISDQWRDSVNSIIAVGTTLVEAKKQLPIAEYLEMVKSDLPFGQRAAEMLHAIGLDQRLANHGSLLPASWRTLYEIHRLPEKVFARGIRDGTINPDMDRKDVALLAPKATASRPAPKAATETAPEAARPAPSPASTPAPTREPSGASPPKWDALDGVAQVLDVFLRTIGNIDFSEVASASNPAAISKIRQRLPHLRGWLIQLESALGQSEKMDDADADEATALREARR